jgi:hypothetical protein
MAQVISTQTHQATTPSVARLVDATGCHSPATPQEITGQLRSTTFAWLDLENPDDDQLHQYGHALQLDPTPSAGCGAPATGRPSPRSPSRYRWLCQGPAAQRRDRPPRS